MEAIQDDQSWEVATRESSSTSSSSSRRLELEYNPDGTVVPAQRFEGDVISTTPAPGSATAKAAVLVEPGPDGPRISAATSVAFGGGSGTMVILVLALVVGAVMGVALYHYLTKIAAAHGQGELPVVSGGQAEVPMGAQPLPKRPVSKVQVEVEDWKMTGSMSTMDIALAAMEEMGDRVEQHRRRRRSGSESSEETLALPNVPTKAPGAETLPNPKWTEGKEKKELEGEGKDTCPAKYP